MGDHDTETSAIVHTARALQRLRAPGLLLGVGLGGFFDGIFLHQVLQWHHMLTDAGDSWMGLAAYPDTTLDGLRINTLWDGLFHATTYIFVLVGLAWMWQRWQRNNIPRPPTIVTTALDPADRLAVRRLGNLQPGGRHHRSSHLGHSSRLLRRLSVAVGSALSRCRRWTPHRRMDDDATCDQSGRRERVGTATDEVSRRDEGKRNYLATLEAAWEWQLSQTGTSPTVEDYTYFTRFTRVLTAAVTPVAE